MFCRLLFRLIFNIRFGFIGKKVDDSRVREFIDWTFFSDQDPDGYQIESVNLPKLNSLTALLRLRRKKGWLGDDDDLLFSGMGFLESKKDYTLCRLFGLRFYVILIHNTKLTTDIAKIYSENFSLHDYTGIFNMFKDFILLRRTFRENGNYIKGRIREELII